MELSSNNKVTKVIDKLFVAKCNKLLKISAIIYTVRRWNSLPLKYAQPLYILLLSPLLLTQALWRHDTVSYNYRRFLMSFTYPECNFSSDAVYRRCDNVHPAEPSCRSSFLSNIGITVKRVFRLYSRLYFFHTIVTLILARKNMSWFIANKIIKSGLINTLRSTAFLSGQTITQRALLCAAANKKLSISPKSLYAMSVIGSVPILFERRFRVRQLNSMIISHLIAGQRGIMEEKILKLPIPFAGFLATVASDRLSVVPIAILLSLLTSLQF